MSQEKGARRPKGTVFIRPEVCKGCAYCIEFCPAECIKFSEAFNAKGYHYPVLAHPEACTGCGLCGLYCPDFAIFGVRLKDLPEVPDPLVPEAKTRAG